MALIVGIGLSKIPAKFQVFFLLVISVEAIANQQHDFFIKHSEKYKLSFERTVDKYIPKKDLIIINAGPNPQEIYFTHRKGWSYENFILNQPQLDSLNQIGANYLIINKERYFEPISYYPKIYSGPNYDIYQLKKKK